MVGIEPALKHAVQFMEHPRVLVMATARQSGKKNFNSLWHGMKRMLEIYPLACPGIVEFVEAWRIKQCRIEGIFIQAVETIL